MRGELIIGLMSGTSVDGIDAALVEFKSSSELSVVETDFTPFGPELKESINQLALNNSLLNQESDIALHAKLADHYAEASFKLIAKAGVNAVDISAIANHGQTIRHEPNAKPPFSLQLGDGQKIANLTGINTLTQFRQADLAAGGQGAPLMPAFHRALFAGSQDPTYILNLGGIANITWLGDGIINDNVIGFDTGPANTLMDQWAQQHLNKSYDENGQWADSGKVIKSVLDRLLNEPYFSSNYPKSTGPDYFNLDWLNEHIENLTDYAPCDIQASLLMLTANTVALGIKQISAGTGRVYVCGGGAKNQTLLTALGNELAGFEIKLTDELGIPSDWVESVGFAWLGYCCLHNIDSNLPSVTGAKRSVVLGEVYKPN